MVYGMTENNNAGLDELIEEDLKNEKLKLLRDNVKNHLEIVVTMAVSDYDAGWKEAMETVIKLIDKMIGEKENEKL
jgi:hypothetical protein